MKQNTIEYLKTGANFTIRNMKKEEKKQVRKLVWHCFPVTDIFSIEPSLKIWTNLDMFS